MSEMPWEEKLAAINGLHVAELSMSSPGNWAVYTRGVESQANNSCILRGGLTGRGTTPEEAVEDHWANLTEHDGVGSYLVIDAMRDSRRHIYWNGYRWVDLVVTKK